MVAAPTSKRQLTVPLGTTAVGLAGLSRRPGRKPVSLRAIDEAIEATAAELNPRAEPRRAR